MFPFNELTDYQFKHLDEPLDVIRVQSKPLLRYPREYQEALRELVWPEWPALKDKLSGPQADQGLDCLNRYMTAWRASVCAYNAYKRTTPEEYEQTQNDWYASICYRNDIRKLLD